MTTGPNDPNQGGYQHGDHQQGGYQQGPGYAGRPPGPGYSGNPPPGQQWGPPPGQQWGPPPGQQWGPPPGPPQGRPPGRRQGLLIGLLSAAVVALAVALILVLVLGGDDDPENTAGGKPGGTEQTRPLPTGDPTTDPGGGPGTEPQDPGTDPTDETTEETTDGGSGDEQAVRDQVEKFFAAANSGDWDAVADLTCSADNEELVADMQAQFDQVGGSIEYEVGDVTFVDDETGSVSLTLSVLGSTEHITVDMVNEDGQWKYCGT